MFYQMKKFHLYLKVASSTTKNETELFLKNELKFQISEQLNIFLHNHFFKNSHFPNLIGFI